MRPSPDVLLTAVHYPPNDIQPREQHSDVWEMIIGYWESLNRTGISEGRNDLEVGCWKYNGLLRSSTVPGLYVILTHD